MKICKFTDYAPHVFYELRTIFGISTESYLRSIGPETMLTSLLQGNLNALKELVSEGKSGSFFYYSADARFILKTIHRDEFLFLRHILREYYSHLSAHQSSLIIRYFGLHKLEYSGGKIYFVIMSNAFNTRKEIHERFDIKGSTHGRITTDK
jgi:1-phosphatidylinositol-4-phosphate 5-kinase